ncbi:hypothetical protein AWC37_04240 [Staphylococcus xylosus]|uniref:hypothetical protein n=1 Tax=Staphylococcus xylosus TaxID=1288 RepID=UPI0009BCF015|nr:hypothetical protein [Staphylococcus xylosus]ARD74373.1 hypothetical protein AWC37_04240 [Staphylococcus xylosus]
MKMLKELFNITLVFTGITLTFAFSYLTSYFVNDGTWLTFLYFFIFMGMAFGVKQIGRYYVENFL